MMSMTCPTLGTGVHGGEDLPGGAGRMSAPYGKPKCSRWFTTLIPRMPSAVLMPKETAHHSLTPSGVTSFVTATLTSEPSLRTSSLSKPSMMTPSSLERERNSQSAVVPQGRGDGSALKVTGSLPLIGLLMPSSGPIHTAEMSCENTTNTSQPNSLPVSITGMSHSMRLLHGNMSSKMGTSPSPTPTNLLTLCIATSNLTDWHTKMTSHPKIDPRVEGARREAQLRLAASIT